METQTNPDSHLLEAYAELKQKCADLEKMNAHLSFKFNQAKDPEFDAQKKIIKLESELAENKEIIAKLKELRRADGLEMNSLRLTSENLLREVTHLNELRRESAKELNFKEQEALAYKTWYEAEVDKPDNDSWKRKYDTLVDATDFCVDLIKSALKGNVYKQLNVEWNNGSSESCSE